MLPSPVRKQFRLLYPQKVFLNPPVEALVDQGNLEGFAYLKAYEDRAWSHDQHLEVSKPGTTKVIPTASSLMLDRHFHLKNTKIKSGRQM